MGGEPGWHAEQAEKSRAARVRATLEEQGEIVRRVDVEPDAGEAEDERLKSRRPRRPEVVLEGRLPELERQAVRRLEEYGVGAEAGK